MIHSQQSCRLEYMHRLLSIQIASATLSARMEAVADTARNRLGLRQNEKLMY